MRTIITNMIRYNCIKQNGNEINSENFNYDKNDKNNNYINNN